MKLPRKFYPNRSQLFEYLMQKQPNKQTEQSYYPPTFSWVTKVSVYIIT